LRRWEELRGELDARGVRIVTLCSDSPAQIRAGRAKHGLGAVMLSDETLAVTDRYGLRNPRAFAPRPGGGAPTTLRALPIPTTILVDANGVVRWIDQSTDYQVRSSPERVRAALAALES
jgi:peroxiredoxin